MASDVHADRSLVPGIERPARAAEAAAPNPARNLALRIGFLVAVTVMVSSALVAFAFAYFRFRGRDFLFGIVLASMALPGVVTMIPNFLIWDALGWNNTLVPLWAGNLFASPFYIFLLRQFFLGLPRDLWDAAHVDGANYLRTWWSVALPLTLPALIVVFVF